MEFAIKHMRTTAIAAFADIASEAEKTAKAFETQGSMWSVSGRESKAASEDIKRTMADMNQAVHAAAEANAKDLVAPFLAEQKVLDSAIGETKRKLQEASTPIIVHSRFGGAEQAPLDKGQMAALKQELQLYEQINTQLGSQIETQKQMARNSEAELAEAQKKAAKEAADKRIAEEQRVRDATRQMEQQTYDMYQKGVAAQLSGDDAIYHEQQVMVDKARALMMKTLDDTKTSTAERIAAEKLYDTTVVAADQIAQAKIQAAHEATTQQEAQKLAELTVLQERAAQDMKTAQENAALAVVPDWQKATAQIEMELNRRLRAIQDEEMKALDAHKSNDAAQHAIDQDAQAKRIEAWTQADQRIREEQKRLAQQLGGELESVFNDMTSGKIGQTILNNMKKLFFEIMAQWLLTTKAMGSGFGNLFGSLVFGPGSTGAGVFGGGNAGIGGMLGGLFGAGASAPAGAATPPFVPPGASSASLLTGAPSSAAGSADPLSNLLGVSSSPANALTTQAISSATGGATGSGGLAAPKLGSSIGGLFSMNSLVALGGMLPALFGGKIGGGVGQVGGMLASLSIMAAMNPGGVAAGLLSHLGLAGGLAGTLFAAAGPALLGFGIGSNFGPLGGALAGAGAGFATGALIGLAGGPIGAVVGAIIGAIAGLFGGLFGGSKRKHQANDYFSQQVEPAVKQIVAQYEGFQLDYASATGQLEQLRQQAQDQLKKLKGEGTSVFQHRVGPAIDAAEQQIGADEKERTRRAGLMFGPPQFHDGGLISTASSAWTTRPQEMLALVKEGEFVVNQQATTRHRGTLEAINNGGSPGVQIGGISITASVLDRNYVTSRQFAQDVITAIRTANNFGMQ